MNTNLRHIAFAIAALAGSIVARPVLADHEHYEAIDSLAHQAQGLTRELSREARQHLAGTREYRSIQSDIASLLHLEGRIANGAHASASPNQLHRDVEKLHDAIHHLEEHLAEIQNDGHGHHHGHFHSHRVDVRHLSRIVGRLDTIASKLDEEVHELQEHFVPQPVYSRPGVALRPGGVSVGGFSLQFGR